MAYASGEYYTEIYKGSAIQPEGLEKALREASKRIDTLTYNRIVGKGFLNLTPFQQQTITEVCCELADFYQENEDLVESVLKNYSVNGVSMGFGESWNVSVFNGIAMKRSTYEELSKTGLCCRRLV